MLHLLKQQSRLPHPSQGPWCCPRWRANDSSGLQSLTPGRCRWRGWLQMFGSDLAARRSGCCPALLADRGCWWWSPQCSPEGCWPQWGRCWEPTLWDSYRRWSLSGWRSIPAPASAQQFSIDNVTHGDYSQPRKTPKQHFFPHMNWLGLWVHWSRVPACVRPAAPPAVASPPGWPSGNRL